MRLSVHWGPLLGNLAEDCKNLWCKFPVISKILVNMIVFITGLERVCGGMVVCLVHQNFDLMVSGSTLVTSFVYMLSC